MPLPVLLHRILTFGRLSEILGIDYLRTKGYRIVTSGYRTKAGEADVIAWGGPVLVFFEVKARQNAEPPEDSVGARKQQRVIRAAQAYRARYHLQEAPYR